MFDIASKRLAWIPVEIPGFASEGDEPGKNTKATIELKVDLVDRETFRELFFPDDTGDTASEVEKAKRDESGLFKRLVSDWRGVVANGSPVPFNDENIAAALRVPNFPEAFGDAYMAAWQGRAKVRLGNSKDSAQNGLASAAESE